MDKHHGHGGSFKVNPATREREIDQEATKPSDAGARDKDGRPIEEKKADKPEAALPRPARAPWDELPVATESTIKKTKGA